MTPSNRRRCAAGLIVCALVLWAAPGWAQEAATLAHGSPASVGMDAGSLDEAVQLYRDAVARVELKGAVLMVARRGVIVMQEAVGWRHEAYQLPMERDTIFRMASNTKPVVATAVLILQEEGKLSLDDTVATHLDSFDNFRSREITIQQLLTHASGIRIGPIFYPFGENGYVDLTQGYGREIDPSRMIYSSPVAVAGDTIITGSIVQDTNIRLRARFGPLLSPPVLRGAEKPYMQVPGAGGGANWQGAAVDVETGRLFVSSSSISIVVEVIEYPPPATIGHFTNP